LSSFLKRNALFVGGLGASLAIPVPFLILAVQPGPRGNVIAGPYEWAWGAFAATVAVVLVLTALAWVDRRLRRMAAGSITGLAILAVLVVLVYGGLEERVSRDRSSHTMIPTSSLARLAHSGLVNPDMREGAF